MGKMPENKELVLYRKRREPTLAVVRSSNGKEINIINEEGKQSTISSEKIIYRSGIIFDKIDDTNYLRSEFRNLRQKLRNNMSSRNIKPLWESVKDTGRELAFEELIGLYEGTNKLSKEDKLQLFWTIDKERDYFKRNKDGYIPNTRAEVNFAILKKERERLNDLERERAVEWAKSVIDEDRRINPPEGLDTDHYVNLVIEYVTSDHSTPQSKESKRFISETGIRTEEEAIAFLQKLGVCGKDDDDVSLRLKSYEDYGSRVIRQSENILNNEYDLDHLPTYNDSPVYSIDDEDTEDIDDAISYEETDKGYKIGIHITNVGFFIEKRTDLDRDAMLRGESVYLPEKTINMLPPDLVYKKLSLFEDSYKPTLSLFVDIDKDFNIVDYEFKKSKITVDRNLTYTYAEKIFSEENWGINLKKLAMNLRQKRIENNAFLLQLPDFKFDIDENGNVTLIKNYMDTVPHIVISELMILINYLAADILRKNNIPCIYRTQTEEVSEEARQLDRRDPLYPVKILKYLKPSRLSISPSRHSSLGLDYYTQISSPIRRYLDIVVQRQITCYLDGNGTCYSENELENIIEHTGTGMIDRRFAQKNRKKYWIFKYLGNNRDELEGYVSSVNDRKINIYFPDILMELPISKPAQTLTEGDRVLVTIKDVQPLKRKINLKFKSLLNN